MQSRRRTGGVLPLVAVFMVAAALCAGIVLDMSRAYAQKNELQTAVDAAALSGVMELYQDTTNVFVAASDYSSSNPVLHRSIASSATSVVCGSWDDDSQNFSPSDHCGAGDNAVTFTAGDTATFTFPLLLGFSSRPISAMARAWMAFVNATTCVKPWAIDYALLTAKLDPSGAKDPYRELDAEDLEMLKSLPPGELRFALKIGSPPGVPGSFGALDIPNPAVNGSAYRENIATCNMKIIGRDTLVWTEPGNMVGPTLQGARDLCQPLTSAGYCMDGSGDVGLNVIAPLWAPVGPQQGKSLVQIKGLVAFKLEQVTAGAEIIGYFIPGTHGGAIGPQPSTVTRPILVQ
jgi:hypothetical protein